MKKKELKKIEVLSGQFVDALEPIIFKSLKLGEVVWLTALMDAFIKTLLIASTTVMIDEDLSELFDTMKLDYQAGLTEIRAKKKILS